MSNELEPKEMDVSKELLEAHGYVRVDEPTNNRFEKKIGDNSALCFGTYFNGPSFYLMLNDGNEGHIFVGANVESWEDGDALVRMLSGVLVDVGHTLTET